MSLNAPSPDPSSHQMPVCSVIVAAGQKIYGLSEDGEIFTADKITAKSLFKKPVLLCHAPYTFQKLNIAPVPVLDALELFAFTHPARFCNPTPAGLARALGLAVPESSDDLPLTLFECVGAMLEDLGKMRTSPEALKMIEIAAAMGQGGKAWPWSRFVIAALGGDSKTQVNPRKALNIWEGLPEWAEEAPPPPNSFHGIDASEIRERLQSILRTDDRGHEIRPQQLDYAIRMGQVFDPPRPDAPPALVEAEAGTGTGKTLGYLAPASLWADKNQSPVWLTTYTKNLQQQIEGELDRVYFDPALKDQKVAVRKGRENYLCLLNYEELAGQAINAHGTGQMVAAGLMARWLMATKDGDLTSHAFPGWLAALLGFANSYGLADRRGECIYAACDHYRRCFIERANRKSAHASLVVANHALVMQQAAMAMPGDAMPHRYVFDEGHHLFDAADSAFGSHLTAREGVELRRWILGAEDNQAGRSNRRASRMRGLKARLDGVIDGDDLAETALFQIQRYAKLLPMPGWQERISGSPANDSEDFLSEVYKQVISRADGRDGPYSIETALRPASDSLAEGAAAYMQILKNIRAPMAKLAAHLQSKLADETQTLESDSRKRIDALSRSLQRRVDFMLSGWIAMLDSVKEDSSPDEFTDWLEIERIDGKIFDCGYYRHWVNPMIPFANSMATHAKGIGITSATLHDPQAGQGLDDLFTGASYLTKERNAFSLASPFNYPEQTRIFLIDDVAKDNVEQMAAAYRLLFESSGGKALGLFTAISRLKKIHALIADPMDNQNIPLYAQHVDGIDKNTLIEMFKEETHACLLGTDAVRDGVDVPGESLQLLVFDRIPWPRPTILHKSRRTAFGGRGYDEWLTRRKLRQAYGRLIRKADDKGVFVLMDSRLPTRLYTAFPDGVDIQRTGIKNAAEQIAAFLKP